MTPNKEDYLKCIYQLSLANEKVTNKQVAELMGFSAPAITAMMKKLLAENLIIKTASQGYLLTENGQLLVADLYRKHRLIEVFLVQELGYTIDQVHDEAEILEHTVSDLFIQRLEKALEYPKTCPHGGSIPDQGELLIERYAQTLAEFHEPDHYQLVRVQDDYQLLKYLEKQDIQVGCHLRLLNFDPYTSTYNLEISDRPIQLPLAIAKKLYVEK